MSSNSVQKTAQVSTSSPSTALASPTRHIPPMFFPPFGVSRSGFNDGWDSADWTGPPCFLGRCISSTSTTSSQTSTNLLSTTTLTWTSIVVPSTTSNTHRSPSLAGVRLGKGVIIGIALGSVAALGFLVAILAWRRRSRLGKRPMSPDEDGESGAEESFSPQVVPAYEGLSIGRSVRMSTTHSGSVLDINRISQLDGSAIPQRSSFASPVPHYPASEKYSQPVRDRGEVAFVADDALPYYPVSGPTVHPSNNPPAPGGFESAYGDMLEASTVASALPENIQDERVTGGHYGRTGRVSAAHHLSDPAPPPPYSQE